MNLKFELMNLKFELRVG